MGVVGLGWLDWLWLVVWCWVCLVGLVVVGFGWCWFGLAFVGLDWLVLAWGGLVSVGLI